MSVTDGSWPCVVRLSVNVCSEPLVMGRRGCTGRNLNGKTVGS